jgi:DNA polymerase III alpha subunit
MKIVPLFKTHYSLGRSILTLENPDSCIERGPRSVISLASESNLEDVFLVEDNMSSFLQAYTNLSEAKLNLRYGIRLTFCPNLEDKSEESRSKSCKYIIFAKNERGYKKLIKIYSMAAKKGFYYEARMDFSTLKKHWDNKDLILAIPFYDSFIYNNHLTHSACVPELGFAEPVFFVEDNNLPFEGLLRSKIEKFCKNKYETTKTKSIYYELKKDFKSYLTFRCINNRSSLDRPQLNHMGSNEFCLESWKEKNDAA